MGSPGAKPDATVAVLRVPPMAWARWVLLVAAWGLFFAGLPLKAVDMNFFMRWRYETSTLGLHSLIFWHLPQWIVLNLRGRELGYIPAMDLMWWLAAFGACAFFLASPLFFFHVRRPPTLLILRYVALVLLVVPITVFLPEDLRFPQPRIGLYLLAAAHSLVLVALWCPWPLLRRQERSFEIETTGPP